MLRRFSFLPTSSAVLRGEAREEWLAAWRTRILDAVLVGYALLGVVAYIPSVRLAWANGLVSIVVVDTVALVGVFVLLFARRISYGVRAGTLLVGHYVVSVVLLVTTGPFGAGPVWLFAFPVLTAVFFGTKASIAAIAVTTATLLTIGILLPPGAALWRSSVGDQPGLWGVLAANFLLLDAAVTISVAVLLQALDEAARERTRLARAVEQASNPLALTDPAGRIEYVNQAFADSTGLVGADAVGRTLEEAGCFGSATGGGQEVRRALAERERWRGLLTNLRADGTRYEAEAALYPVREVDEVVHMVFTWRDVTRERSLEAQLLQAQKMEAVGTLAGGIAHDFNNLLVPLTGNLGVALEGMDDPEREELVREALQAARQARSLVRQLLIFSRRDLRERRLLAVGRLLQELGGILRALVPPGCRLEIRVDDGDGELVAWADPVEVQQILVNLVSNAGDALAGSRGTVTVLARGHEGPDVPADGEIHLEVRDTGTGIAPEVVERVLEPFFTTKPPGRGTGLGLSVVHEIVRSLGGHLEIESEPGKGTRVRVRVPRRREPLPAVEEATGAPPRGDREHILLLDDEEAVLRTTRRILERLGYRVTACLGGEAGLEVWRRDPADFDLVLTDLAMPEVTGLEVARAVHEGGSGTPVILTTGYLDGEARVDLEGSGVRRVLTKPFDVESVAAAVAETLRDGQQADGN